MRNGDVMNLYIESVAFSRHSSLEKIKGVSVWIPISPIWVLSRLANLLWDDNCLAWTH